MAQIMYQFIYNKVPSNLIIISYIHLKFAKKPQQPSRNLKLKLTKTTFPTLFFNLSKITTSHAIPLTSVMHPFVMITRRHLS